MIVKYMHGPGRRVHRHGFKEHSRTIPWKTVCGLLVLASGVKVTKDEDRVTCRECRTDRKKSRV